MSLYYILKTYGTTYLWNIYLFFLLIFKEPLMVCGKKIIPKNEFGKLKVGRPFKFIHSRYMSTIFLTISKS